MEKKVRKKIILTIVALVLVPLFMWHFLGDTTAEMNPNCELPRYVKIGEHVFKFLPENNIYLRKDGDNIGAKCLQTTQTNPVEVDELQFTVLFPISGLEQIALMVRMKNTSQVGVSNKNKYDQMLSDLKQQGKSIDDLSKKDGFYTYIYSQEHSLTRYFASQDHLKDAIDAPLMMEGCAGNFPLTCRAFFHWSPEVKVFMSALWQPQALQDDSIKIWDEIYVRTIEAFNQKIVH